MNSGNSKTSDPHRLLRSFTEKINSKRSNEYVALSDLSIYYTWKSIKKSHIRKINSTWNEEFELPDRSYSVSDIQDYFKYILKSMRQLLLILQ